MVEIVHPVDTIMTVEASWPILLDMGGDEIWFTSILCVAVNTCIDLKIIELLSMAIIAI